MRIDYHMSNVDKNTGLAVFTAGYRWSGSGAVSDWLGGHEDLCRVNGSEAAFGEIRAVNYGLRYLVQTAAGRIPYGERLGRWALCPEPEMWPEILGGTLTRERGALSGLYALVDYVYFTAARFHVIPRVTKYKQMLDTQLGMDFRNDEEYLQLVTDLNGALREYMRRKREEKYSFGPEHDEPVRLAASRILSLFYRRLGQDGRVLIFDNAISGLNPELFHLLHPSYFSGQVIIFVRRDPRDQFAELVKYSGSTFSWSVGKFIRQYRNLQEKGKMFLDSVSPETSSMDESGCSRFIRQVSFEAFVLDKDDTRTRLKEDLQEFWASYGIKYVKDWSEGSSDVELVDGANGLFNPEKSKVNIGIWRNAGLTRQMQRISNELSEYIEE